MPYSPDCSFLAGPYAPVVRIDRDTADRIAHLDGIHLLATSLLKAFHDLAQPDLGIAYQVEAITETASEAFARARMIEHDAKLEGM